MTGPAIAADHLALLEAAHDLVAVTPRRAFEALSVGDAQYRLLWSRYQDAYEAYCARIGHQE